MLFWVIAALLTLGASLAVLLPLAGRAAAARGRWTTHDLEVYRDQLAELDRDAARGLIQPAEAEQARAEIGTAYPQRADRSAEPTPPGAGRSVRALSAVRPCSPCRW